MDDPNGSEGNPAIIMDKNNDSTVTCEHIENKEAEQNCEEVKIVENVVKEHKFAVPTLPVGLKHPVKEQQTEHSAKKQPTEQSEISKNAIVVDSVSEVLCNADKNDTDTMSGTSINPSTTLCIISTTIDNTSIIKSNTPDNASVTKNNIETNTSISKEKTKDKKIKFPYDEPNWSGVPDTDKMYSLTVLKDGTIKNNFDLSGKSLFTFGRLADCDVMVEHPSCSRYHAVLQYCTVEKNIRKVGYYLYDLGSTHGTFVNKEKVKAKVYVRVRVGYQIKFGGSSRLYIMEGPEEDQEDEVDMEVIHQKRLEHKQKMSEQGQKRSENMVDGDDDGATWGFGEDAEEEELNFQDLLEKKKDIEVKEPKKTLRGFFDREGIEFEYEMTQRGAGNSIIHVAQVRLPIETGGGVEVIAEGTSSNKKDAVLLCATDACKLIQAYDMMQNTCREDQRMKRQRELEANDFYDSDDDNYLDRTGSVEKKRLKRKQWAGKMEQGKTDTHESLKIKLEEKVKLLLPLEEKLNLSHAASETEEDGDSLEAYMSSMKNRLDKKSESRIKRQITELKNEIMKLEKLVEKTQPALPAFIMKAEMDPPPGLDEMNQTNDTSALPVKPNTPSSMDDVDKNASKSKDQMGNKIVSQLPAKEKTPSNTDHGNNNVCKPMEKGENKIADIKETCPKKKKRVYGPAMMPKKTVDAEFVEWLPPVNQTGDGRTHLNDKLGY